LPYQSKALSSKLKFPSSSQINNRENQLSLAASLKDVVPPGRYQTLAGKKRDYTIPSRYYRSVAFSTKVALPF